MPRQYQIDWMNAQRPAIAAILSSLALAISPALTISPALAGPPPIEFLGRGAIPGEARDRSGLTDSTGGVPHDRLGSFGSGIDFLGTNNLYVAVDDRGPNDGMSDWRCRLQILEITISPGTTEPVAIALRDTILLTTETRAPLTGFRGQLADAGPSTPQRYDPEGVRVAPDGSIFISEEYGPSIDFFAIRGPDAGVRRARLRVPEKFTITSPHGDPERERDDNRRGRVPNRGFEGLALSTDASRLYAITQSPLIQDGGADKKSRALNVRILELPLAAGADSELGIERELIYPLEHPDNVVSEILALSESELLVLERDGEAGTLAERRAIYHIDLADAHNVSHIEPFPPRGMPPRKRAVRKTIFIDFMDPRWGLAGTDMPEKLEGLCWGPRLADGRRTLLVTVDNDLKAANPNWVWVFAVDPAAPPR